MLYVSVRYRWLNTEKPRDVFVSLLLDLVEEAKLIEAQNGEIISGIASMSRHPNPE